MFLFLLSFAQVSACNDWGSYQDPADPTGNTCLKCDIACGSCTGPGAYSCTQCSAGNTMIEGICMQACALGYTNTGGICKDSTSDGIAFDLDFSRIENNVKETIQVSGNQIPLSAGNSSSFYPNYDYFDPYVVKNRGFYFDGNAYFKGENNLLTFGPVFTIALWVKPVSGTGFIFAKQNNAIVSVAFSLKNFSPVLSFSLLNLEIFTSPRTASSSQWNFIMTQMTLSSFSAKISITVNTNSDFSSVYSSFFTDLFSDFYTTFAAQRSSGAFSDFYKGFVWMFKIANQAIPASRFIQSIGCSGCSYCPAGTNACLSSCSVSQFIDESSLCQDCSQNCQTFGCVRGDKKCNLCFDQLCYICDSFGKGCTQCVANAFLNTTDGTCVCNYKFSWDSASEQCILCDPSCETCSAEGTTSCTSCVGGYLLNGACHPFCPTGYSSTNNKCIFVQNKIFSLDFSKIQGIVPESANGYQVITGSSSQFYPVFDSADPWPEINRGYYFSGSKYLDLPPNSASSSYFTIGNQFTFSFWLRSESDGTIYSKQSSVSTTCLIISILSSRIYLDILLSSNSNYQSTSIIQTNWTYAVVYVAYQNNATTSVKFIVNRITETYSLGPGFYTDLQQNMKLTIGAKLVSSTYSSFLKGFLYSFNIYSFALDPAEFTLSCDKSLFPCSICPDSSCLDLCPHTSYSSGSSCITCNVCSYESCRRNDKSCNLCFDVQCEVCSSFLSGSCSKCKPNAVLQNGACSCNNGWYWNSSQESCVQCSGVVLNNACLKECPTGFTLNGKNCVGSLGLIFSIALDKKIQGKVVDLVGGKISVTTGMTNEFYPYYDLDDPFAGKDRGYYFDGVSGYMKFAPASDNVNGLVFSPDFSIAFWVYVVAPGVVLAKQSGNTVLLIDLKSGLNVEVQVLLNQISSLKVPSQNPVSLNWNFIGVRFLLGTDLSTSAQFYINKLTEQPVFLENTLFNDISSSYTLTLGSCYNKYGVLTSYFTGYIQSMKVWNFNYDLSQEYSTSCSSCSICPNSGSCFPSCSVSQFYLNTCSSCRSQCSKGCVRLEDCNLCYDRLCEICSDYSSTGCSKCVDGASFVNGICQCTSGAALSRSNGNLYCASPCAGCLECYSEMNGDCVSCSTGSYLDSGICVSSCPLGKVSDGGACKGQKSYVYWVFNKTVNSVPDKVSGLKAFMGSSGSYYPYYDENDPIAVYQRGVYFDGNKKYVQLPSNPAENNEVIFGNTHSVKTWVKPLSQGVSSPIAVKELNSAVFVLSLTKDLTPQVLYTVSSINNNLQSSSLTVSGNKISSDWHQILIQFSRSGRSTTATIFIDGYSSAPSYVLLSYFNEITGLIFKLGYSQSQSSSYKGFIYEFAVYNYIIPPNDPTLNTCTCSTCTESGDCLVSCSQNQYLSAGLCTDCLSSCSSCLEGKDCELNSDSLCAAYTGFTVSECTQCEKLAIKSQTCQCVPFSVLASSGCSCLPSYEEVLNNCEPCFYSLQSSDIDSYFSQDFSSLKFDLKYPVQASTSSDCSVLFTASTLTLLGNPLCWWTSSMTELIVTLNNSLVINGSNLTFKGNTLLTNLKTCGSNRGPISKLVYFKFSPPFVTPQAFIDAPFDYYIFCGNLYISGARSTGGFGRKLKFVWNFVSNPELPILNLANLTATDLLYINETLSPSSVQVKLIVSNWLGFSSSAQQTIQINDGVGINLVLDKNIKWQLYSQHSKSIYVQPSSLCKVSDSLTYTWSLVSMTGNDSSFKADLFWASQKTQSKLYVPKGALGPGYYLFMLVVHDNLLGINGKTYLTLSVEYSKLAVRFNPEYLTVGLNDFSLNGDAAEDPDNLSGSMEYQWTCFNGNDCSEIISSQTSKSPLVKKESLNDLSEYVFTLTVRKGERTSSGNLTVFVNKKSKIGVVFTPHPNYINNQEVFVLKTKIETPCNCSYKWEIGGGNFTLSGSDNGKDIAFADRSLTPGNLYTGQLEVTDDQSQSVFKESFKVDIVPEGGDFTFSVIPSSNIYRLNAPDWNDPKDNSLPLSYQFGFYYNQREVYLNVRNESSVYYTLLPPLNLSLFVRVYNTIGSYAEKSLPYVLISSALNDTDLLETLGFYTSLTWSDPDILPSYLSLALLTFNKTSTINSTIAFNLTIQALNKVLSALQEPDFNKLDVLMSLTYLSAACQLYTDKSPLYNLLNKYSQLISDNSIPLSNKRGQSYIDIIKSATNFSHELVSNSPSSLIQINEIFKFLGICSIKSLGQTQSLRFGNSSLVVSFSMIRGDLLQNYSSYLVSLPTANQLFYNSSTSIFILESLYNSEFYNTTKEYSAALEFSVVQVEGQSGTVVAFDLKDSGFFIKVPVWNLQDSPKCVFWDLDKWSDKGCDWVGLAGNVSSCTCSHTSLYTSGSHFINDPIINTSPIVIYIACLVALLWFILAAFLLLKDKKEAEIKSFVDQVLSGIPSAALKKSPRVLPNEIADQLGRTEKVGERKDSNYIPAANIGIVGSYLDDKRFEEKVIDSKKQEEIKEDYSENPQKKLEKTESHQSFNSSVFSILPSQNFEEQKKKPGKIAPVLHPVIEEAKASQEISKTFEEKPKQTWQGPSLRPPKIPGLEIKDFEPEDLSKKSDHAEFERKNYETGAKTLVSRPKIPGLEIKDIEPDEESPLKIKDLPKESLLKKQENFEFEKKVYKPEPPTRTGSKTSFKRPSLPPIEINPNEDEGIDLDMPLPKIKEPEFKPKKFEYIVSEDVEVPNPAPGPSQPDPQCLDINLKRIEEEKYENTQLFTQTGSPQSMLRPRKKNDNQEILPFQDPEDKIYPAWVANYFFSAIFYYHEVFSRAARCSQGVCSFLLQAFCIGIVIGSMGRRYAKEKGQRFDVKVRNISFQDVAIAFCMCLLCNLAVGIMMCIICKKKTVPGYASDREKQDIAKANQKVEIFGAVFMVALGIGCVVGVGFVEMNMEKDGSALWAICLFICFIFDFFFVQIVKVAVYYYCIPGVILPFK